MASHLTGLWTQFIGLIQGQTAMQRPPQLGHFLLLIPQKIRHFSASIHHFRKPGLLWTGFGL